MKKTVYTCDITGEQFTDKSDVLVVDISNAGKDNIATITDYHIDKNILTEQIKEHLGDITNGLDYMNVYTVDSKFITHININKTGIIVEKQMTENTEKLIVKIIEVAKEVN